MRQILAGRAGRALPRLAGMRVSYHKQSPAPRATRGSKGGGAAARARRFPKRAPAAVARQPARNSKATFLRAELTEPLRSVRLGPARGPFSVSERLAGDAC